MKFLCACMCLFQYPLVTLKRRLLSYSAILGNRHAHRARRGRTPMPIDRGGDITARMSRGSSSGGGILEKALGKVSLETGYSLMSWMRLSTGSTTDFTDGVGVVDEDEGEASWKEWTADEVRKHNTREDIWMILYGKVYVVTHYLRYHPGGIDTLLKAAGKDGTALFEKHHSWVNAHGLLEACCVGRLAGSGSTSSPSPPSSPPPPSEDGGRRRKITWDEEGIQAHDAERGVLFGTMKVDHAETPYLYLDEDDPEYGTPGIHPNYLPTHLPDATPPSKPGPYSMPVDELQAALGLLQTDEHGLVNLRPTGRGRWEHADEFGLRRQELYGGEALVAAYSNGLPGTPARCDGCQRPHHTFVPHPRIP